ncbi:30S ribosomal protein S15 [Bienertia sinuspersici]
MIKKAEAKNVSQMMPSVDDADDYDDVEELDPESLNTKGNGSGSVQSKKRLRVKGPLDMYVTSTPQDVLKGRKERKGIFGACDKQLREKVCRDIAKWFYDAGIPFNAATYDSFGVMVESIGQYGSGLKPPTMHELRVPLHKKEVDDTVKEMEEHEKEWAKKGCSLLSDGWHDLVAQKDIVNFLVNSPKGSIFIKSMDVSKVVKDAHLLYQMLDDMVGEVGEPNVVQVVMDNASNYVKAGENFSPS